MKCWALPQLAKLEVSGIFVTLQIDVRDEKPDHNINLLQPTRLSNTETNGFGILKPEEKRPFFRMPSFQY